MALSRVDAELFFLRVLGMLRNPRSQHDPRQIALDYYRTERARGESYNYSEYLSVALRAARSFESAAEGRGNPAAPIVPGPGAIDPTARPGETGYLYRVVVEVYENREYVGSTAVNVASSVPLSAGDAGEQAIEVARGNLPGADYRARVVDDASVGAEFRTIVISSGRIAT